MALKIEKAVDGKCVVLRLSGRLRSENLGELKSLIAESGPTVVLDLDEVTLVDVESINFLMQCHAEGIELQHCPPYICEWIQKEQDRAGRTP